MKYARIERERRYLLTQLPPGLTPDSPHTFITDRYITGTRLRLRHMEDERGNITALKLTQKFNPPECAPVDAGLETIITNIYLNETEYQALSCLQGTTLSKRRYKYLFFLSRNYAIDIFEGALEGLILCEIEFDDHTASHIVFPSFAARKVTHDPFFTGGHLVSLTFADIQNVITHPE